MTTEPLVVSGRRFFFRLADIADAELTASRQSEDPVRLEIDAIEALFAEAVAESESAAEDDRAVEHQGDPESRNVTQGRVPRWRLVNS